MYPLLLSMPFSRSPQPPVMTRSPPPPAIGNPFRRGEHQTWTNRGPVTRRRRFAAPRDVPQTPCCFLSSHAGVYEGSIISSIIQTATVARSLLRAVFNVKKSSNEENGVKLQDVWSGRSNCLKSGTSDARNFRGIDTRDVRPPPSRKLSCEPHLARCSTIEIGFDSHLHSGIYVYCLTHRTRFAK